MERMEQLRKRRVSEQVEGRGVRDSLVLGAMRKVPRERFVPQRLKREAYEDRPLSIGAGQTISQPYIVAFMVEALALRGGEKVLEVGGGSSPLNASGSSPKERPATWQMLAITMCTFVTRMARKAGRIRRRSMPSWCRPVDRTFPRVCCIN